MLSLRGLTGSRLLLTAVVGVVAVVAGVVAVVGMVLSAHHDEAAGRIETRWGPAVAELGAVRAAAGTSAPPLSPEPPAGTCAATPGRRWAAISPRSGGWRTVPTPRYACGPRTSAAV
ncbi:hypothetical protein ACFQ60_05380 [Streptomyces zhihengii]